MDSVMVTLANLSVGYPSRTVRDDIDMTLSAGECILLAGPNGCGKSTLLKTIAGTLSPVGGSVHVSGNCTAIPSRIPRVAGFTVGEFVRLSLAPNASAFSRLDPFAESMVERSLSCLGITHLEDCDISCISDGEFQKACIVVALSRKADVILLDEPTAFLDVDNRIALLETLSSLSHEEGKCIIFSSHDVTDAVRYADRVLALCPDGTTCLSDRTMPKKSVLLQTCFPKLSI